MQFDVAESHSLCLSPALFPESNITQGGRRGARKHLTQRPKPAAFPSLHFIYHTHVHLDLRRFLDSLCTDRVFRGPSLSFLPPFFRPFHPSQVSYTLHKRLLTWRRLRLPIVMLFSPYVLDLFPA